MSTSNLLLVNQHKRSPFGYRLKEAFRDIPNKEIAKKLRVSNSAVTTYMLGRIPPAETLVEISRLTNYSIHWLITGEGERLASVGISSDKKRAHTILITNDKGGATRTTSAVTLAVELARRGYRTLLIDDPSSNATTMLFPKLFPPSVRAHKSLHLRIGMPLPEAKMIFRTPVGGLDLCSFEEGFWPVFIKNKVEKVQISPSKIKEEYRFIIIDTLSHINPFTRINLFIAPLLVSAQVLIPIPLSSMAVGGLKMTLEYLKEASQSSDEIRLLGGFLTLVKPDRRKYLSKKNRDELSTLLSGKLLKTVIHDREEIEDCADLGPIQLTAPKSIGAADYSALTDEILNILENSIE
jgi:chromosome partitioning protein